MRPAAIVPATDPAILRGIGFAVASYACFSTSDAIIKVSSERFSVFEIGFFVSLFAFAPILVLARGQGGWRALLPRRWTLVLARGVLTAACAVMVWSAFGRMPLADGYAILFASPILVTGLSILLLKETVGWRRWLAAAVGFAGVMVMIRPDFATLGTGHLLAVGGAVLGALSFVILRKIGSSETSVAILTVLFGAIMIVCTPMMLLDFVVPTTHELSMLALAGLLQGGGQAVLVMATRETPATVVAPFQYTQMLWAVAYGALLFGDQPTPILFVGMAIVTASGLYTLWRETVRQRPTVLLATRGEVTARAAR